MIKRIILVLLFFFLYGLVLHTVKNSVFPQAYAQYTDCSSDETRDPPSGDYCYNSTSWVHYCYDSSGNGRIGGAGSCGTGQTCVGGVIGSHEAGQCQAGSSNPTASVTFTLPSPAQTINVGDQVAIQAQVTVNGTSNYQVAAYANNTPIAYMQPQGNGVYYTHWTPQTAGTYTLLIDVLDSNSQLISGGTASETVTVGGGQNPTIQITSPQENGHVSNNTSYPVTISVQNPGNAQITDTYIEAAGSRVATILNVTSGTYTGSWNVNTTLGSVDLIANLVENGTTINSSPVHVIIDQGSGSLTIKGVPDPIAHAVKNQNYYQPFVVMNGSTNVTSQYTLSIVGTLPQGLSFASDNITGIPTTSGSFQFSVKATLKTDQTQSKTQQFTLTVDDSNVCGSQTCINGDVCFQDIPAQCVIGYGTPQCRAPAAIAIPCCNNSQCQSGVCTNNQCAAATGKSMHVFLKDSNSKNAITGATVKSVNVANNQATDAQEGSDGEYIAKNLPNGTYKDCVYAATGYNVSANNPSCGSNTITIDGTNDKQDILYLTSSGGVTNPPSTATQAPNSTATTNPNATATSVPNATATTNPNATATTAPTGNPAGSPASSPTGLPSPSPSCLAGTTGFKVAIKVLGIGRATGDNTNPRRTSRSVMLYVVGVDDNGLPLPRGTHLQPTGSVQFNGDIFTGTISVACGLPDTKYLVYIKMDNSLVRKLTQDPISLASGSVNDLSATPIELVPGDVTNDNYLDIADYNIITSCYGNRLCAKKTLSDLNDDGIVDEKDVNIFLRGLATETFGD